MAGIKEGTGDSPETSNNSQNGVVLPISRVKTIMKSSPDVENISQDALFAVTAATEMFIKSLVDTLQRRSDVTEIEYTDLSTLIENSDNYHFLDDICPPKMKGKDVLANQTKPKSLVLTDSESEDETSEAEASTDEESDEPEDREDDGAESMEED